jgi:Xaa-Pro aminopeptidase
VSAPAASRAIPSSRYLARLAAARAALRDRHSSALLVGVGADLRWLTGYPAMESERMTMLVLPADGEARLIVPRLELEPAQAAPAVSGGGVAAVSWQETEDPFDGVAQALAGDAGEGRLLAGDRLWATFLLRAQERFPRASFGLASVVMRDLRIVKDVEEIGLLRAAAHAADRVVEAMARSRLVGRSEADVAREVRDRLVDEGHDEAAFSIVGSGPNSASPHHQPRDRVLAAGEALVLDIGGTIDGYVSDITRTLWLAGERGEGPPPEFTTLYEVLERAHAEATAAVRPGVACAEIDGVARRRIEAAGLGAYFFHRTGHGIGLEGHEDPYLVAGNREPLREGHAFSVEPGIYLEGRYGARIEDIVVCGADGPDVLNQADRSLREVTGLG